ncbi:serine protease easter-like [Contarinia nasturtii]|uniref:serine protease easter-like n=1 Tax=Contarinia nasturtii TaxID=265458 RepID=UPI0012D38FD4|nr:serine protease easter-like [Contarinia nasturtii]
MEMFFIIFSMLFSFSGFINAENPCTTPDGKDGMCIPLRKCPALWRNYRISTKSQRDFVKKSECKTDGNIHWVCCEPSFKESDFPEPGECGLQVRERIVGGVETAPGEYPWLALIKYTHPRYRPRFACGGSLINKNYVLTAAHCVSTSILSGYSPRSVRLGEHDLNTDPDCTEDDGETQCAPHVVDMEFSEIIIHEEYNPSSSTQYNDIALIRLSNSVEFTNFLKPICLPFESTLRDGNLDDVPFVVAGFGRTANVWNATSSSIKMKVDIDGYNWNECNELYSQSLRSTQICVGGIEGKDSCSGDSGGPLMRYTSLSNRPLIYLNGIVSRGHKVCGKKGYPGIYTRVDKYLGWIRRHMKP